MFVHEVDPTNDLDKKAPYSSFGEEPFIRAVALQKLFEVPAICPFKLNVDVPIRTANHPKVLYDVGMI